LHSDTIDIFFLTPRQICKKQRCQKVRVVIL
jgi:hypothetical protein